MQRLYVTNKQKKKTVLFNELRSGRTTTLEHITIIIIIIIMIIIFIIICRNMRPLGASILLLM